MKKVASVSLFFLVLLFSFILSSCDSSSFVYVGDYAFQKQLSYLETGYLEIILKLDPTKKIGYKLDGTPWPIVEENRFKSNNIISDELSELILGVFKKNKKYVGKEWYPEYKVYCRYGTKYIYFIFDLKNLRISSSGRSVALTLEEADLIKSKLDSLLTLNINKGTK